VSSGSRLHSETLEKTSLYNFSKKFVISDIVITNVYHLKSTKLYQKLNLQNGAGMNLMCWTREQPVLLLHKSAVIFETLKSRYMQMNCKVFGCLDENIRCIIAIVSLLT